MGVWLARLLLVRLKASAKRRVRPRGHRSLEHREFGRRRIPPQKDLRLRHDVLLDRKRQAISLPEFLPSVDLQPVLVRDLRAFLRGMADLPEHRRLDETRAELSLRRKGNALTLAVRSLDGDLDYACRKLVHIANEVLLVFLSSHLYDGYKIEALGVDPETIWG